MFKNYLSYQFALNFARTCRAAEVAPETKEKLIRSADQMVDHFACSVQTTDRKDEAKHLFVALLSLRDCKDILGEAGVQVYELNSQYDILEKRLETLCWKSADREKGQMRMLG